MKGKPAKPFRILSLDGGGIRGAFIAAFLADVEKRLGCRIADYFDLLAGTSTGAIIAAALALHEPAARVEAFYKERGPEIFTRRIALPLVGWGERLKAVCATKLLKRYGLDYDLFRQSKYAGGELKSALEEVFGTRTIGADAKTRLVIPALDLTRGQTIVFKTPHLPDLIRDRHYRVTEVLMATTAAPTYFPHAVIGEGSAYVDGGIWANNPSMVAISEALKIREAANREGQDFPIEQESVHLLSIGTGRANYFARPPESGAGLSWWLPRLFDISSAAQSQGTDFQTRYILGERAYRIDYDLPDGTWSLDSLDVVAQMIRMGRERSTESLARLRPVFFDRRAQHPFYPFPDVAPAGSETVGNT